MVQLILVTHGDFAKALLQSAEMIIGEQENVRTLGLHLGEDVNGLREEVREAIEEAGLEQDTIVLTDMKSGSPFNVTASQMETHKFHHITGLNLPMLLEILDRRAFETADEICGSIVENGKATIVNVNQLLEEVRE